MRAILVLIPFIFPLIGQSQNFPNTLSIPDTLGGTQFILNIQESQKQFIPGKITQALSYNGDYLGPTLIFNRGDTVSMQINNNLNEATTVHWHGMRVPAKFDGGPHNIIDSGEIWQPSFKVLDDASTMWYHSHLHHNTLRQVNQGLAGLIIIRDEDEAQFDLPRTYGIDDYPLIIQDKNFDSTGQINHMAVLGDTFLVNGTLAPQLDVPAQMIRFRLLDASIQRTYSIGFSDNRNFKVIASDGGLLESPVELNRIAISPGERFEIVADFMSDLNDSLYLMNYASELPLGTMGGIPGADVYPSPLNGVDKKIMKLKVGASVLPMVDSIPDFFTSISIPDTNQAIKDRYKELTGKAQGGVIKWTINDASFDIDLINDTIMANSTEIWEVHNSTHFAHPFHIHSGHFFILENDSMPPTAVQAGKKDVVLVKPDMSVKFIMKFDNFPDADYPYMYHCHMLDHEDDGMMAQFIMVDSGFYQSVPNIESGQLSIYPNPVSHILNIESGNEIEHPFAISIYDISGVLRMHYQTLNLTNKLDVNHLQSGFYIASIMVDNKVYQHRFVKTD